MTNKQKGGANKQDKKWESKSNKENPKGKTCNSEQDSPFGDTQDARESASLKAQIRAARRKEKEAQEKAEKEAKKEAKAQAEQEAKDAAALKAQIKIARRKEKEAQEKAEKEAKKKAAHDKANPEQNAKSKTKTGQDSKTKSNTEQNTKKAKPNQDSKSNAKTKAKAEQEAKARAEREKAQAEQEAKERAEQEAKTRAEQEAKDAAKAASKKTKLEVLDKLKILKNTPKLVNEFKKHQEAKQMELNSKATIKAQESILDTLFSMYSAIKFSKDKHVTENTIVTNLSRAIPSTSKDALDIMKSVMKLILKEVPNVKPAFENALKEIAPTLKSIQVEYHSSFTARFYDLEYFAKNKIDSMTDEQIINFIVTDVITQDSLASYNLKAFVTLAGDDLLTNVLKLKQVEITSDKQKIITYIESDVEDKIAKLSKACMAKFSTAEETIKMVEALSTLSEQVLTKETNSAGCTNGDWCKLKKSTWKEASNMDEFARKGTNKIFDTLCKLNLPQKPQFCSVKAAGKEYCSDLKTCIDPFEIDSLIKSVSNSPTDSYFNE